ncbi:MAG: GNAT family N-acetyltransferase [Bacteroidota bacterium]
MNDSLAIKELNEQQMKEQRGLLIQLSPGIEQADYERMLAEMLRNGYRMVGVFDGQRCVGISGFWISTKFYCDKYIEPDNVVIDKDYRSRGIGKLLLDWLTEEGKRCGCRSIILDAYVENAPAHRFYFREGFIARGFHFLKKI